MPRQKQQRNPKDWEDARADYIWLYTLWTAVVLGSVGALWLAFLHPDGDFGPFGDLAQNGRGNPSMHFTTLLIALAPTILNIFWIQQTLRDLERKRREDIINPKPQPKPNPRDRRPPPGYDLSDQAYKAPSRMARLGVPLIALAWLVIFVWYFTCAFNDCRPPIT